MNRFLHLEDDDDGNGNKMEEEEPQNGIIESNSKKDKRALKKQKKLVAEFQVSLSNDEMKRVRKIKNHGIFCKSIKTDM